MKKYNIISESVDETVVSEYKVIEKNKKTYQTENELEKEFILMLQQQSYEYKNFNSEKEMIKNLRAKIENLNKITFSDSEWNRFFSSVISNPNLKREDKTSLIQDIKRINFIFDNGQEENLILLDKKNIHNNSLQVINQFKNVGNAKNKYDVTILVNGLPMVHIELKRRGVALKWAFNQIDRYLDESFWANSGLFEYIQIFVISNGTETKYYSNSCRENQINKIGRIKRVNNSFEFTNYWADAKNKRILDLVDFTRTFFSKHTILNILTKYCVHTVDKTLLVMRPYQIVATERILKQIEIAQNYDLQGSIDAGGYIWHTTGSGKTLTSFKTAKLATEIDNIKKVIFIVDRQDLDYQTMREYDRFEKGAANSNSSTAILKKLIEDDKKKIIITTIQKLSIFVKKNPKHDIYSQQIVMIFDECHRSQFGEMHRLITKSFKKYYIFGFTGTPIFSNNMRVDSTSLLKTTDNTFGKRLHTYTLSNAIEDNNVLPFKVDYLKSMDIKEDIEDKEVYSINTEQLFSSNERIKKITEYILKHFEDKTLRNWSYNHFVIDNVLSLAKDRNHRAKIKETKINGFNSILAVSSIDLAKKYYLEFKKQMQKEESKKLNIALIYSFASNEDTAYYSLANEDNENTDKLDNSSKKFLNSVINDYNNMFSTNYDISSEKFQNYYKDISLRMKNREIDILIVVNMFLTGFDAPTLNTLWVDRNLNMHGLLQAFSRTNRILNDVKRHGNIVCFRNLEKQTNDSLRLFGDENSTGIVLLRKFKDYYDGFTAKDGSIIVGYKELIETLYRNFPLDNWEVLGQNRKKGIC
ncbi:type I restriction endonuclease subunit R [Mycoplasma struthionis]|uniref:type I restriction endonuclease subunit R n=1 Tax=Mycoplasma struthionis TaxID=538220 RepID=UPI001C94D7BB|nr:type I restriction endonuclease subunit R [Mycoplasma struthionis]